MSIEIVKFNNSYEERWDMFIENDSINGTFLQQWRFLNYHAKDRFEDCSLIFMEGGKIIGVCPACVVYQEGKKVFYSHMGSTYGGLILCKQILRMEKIKMLLDEFEKYLRDNNFSKCILKSTMDLLCTYSQKILEFFMFFYHYKEYKELNLYIDFENFNTLNLFENFSKMKKRNIKKCLSKGLELKELNNREEIAEFYDVLKFNLLKYDRRPVHTLDELLDLKKRLNSNIIFWGCVKDGKILAGSMVFLFDKVKCAHTQYLAHDSKYKNYNPMAFVYFKMIEIFVQKGYRYISWGITTEHWGSDINYNLANNKEEYGSLHSINYIYEKDL